MTIVRVCHHRLSAAAGGTEATHNGRCGFNFAWMDGWMEKLAERLFFCRRRNKAKAIIIDLLPSSTGRRYRLLRINSTALTKRLYRE
ncbi:Uncharacterized protein APZ42_026510 [Daphnia magna]|uniref:Uncharacterized protein n=1 Tax=Daphnia magna TaxID=35525 RepID=A0A0P5QJE0_9CRUS|nr:Uncharacterized protein APZ42_026510 [Daphnia magna]